MRNAPIIARLRDRTGGFPSSVSVLLSPSRLRRRMLLKSVDGVSKTNNPEEASLGRPLRRLKAMRFAISVPTHDRRRIIKQVGFTPKKGLRLKGIRETSA
jgi:hypothetical protein